MISFLIATMLASHNPYHWTITCARYHELRNEIMLDKNLDYRSRNYLINLFRRKVDGPCDGTFV
jgi:hypothetical protein